MNDQQSSNVFTNWHNNTKAVWNSPNTYHINQMTKFIKRETNSSDDSDIKPRKVETWMKQTGTVPWSKGVFRRKNKIANSNAKNANWTTTTKNEIPPVHEIRKRAKEIVTIMCKNNTFEGVIRILDEISNHVALKSDLKSIPIGQSVIAIQNINKTFVSEASPLQ